MTGLSGRFWREVREYLGAFVVAFLVVTFGFTTVGVAGPSMEPTLNGGSGRLPESLLVGDRVFVPKYETWLRRLGVMDGYNRGSVVIVREPADSPARQGMARFRHQTRDRDPGRHRRGTCGAGFRQRCPFGSAFARRGVFGSGKLSTRHVG